MGDRWTLTLRCTFCGKTNDDVWYAPSCNCTTFNCEHCKKTNQIVQGFSTIPYIKQSDDEFDN